MLVENGGGLEKAVRVHIKDLRLMQEQQECLKRPFNVNRGRESVIEARRMRIVRESANRGRKKVNRGCESGNRGSESVRV